MFHRAEGMVITLEQKMALNKVPAFPQSINGSRESMEIIGFNWCNTVACLNVQHVVQSLLISLA